MGPDQEFTPSLLNLNYWSRKFDFSPIIIFQPFCAENLRSSAQDKKIKDLEAPCTSSKEHEVSDQKKETKSNEETSVVDENLSTCPICLHEMGTYVVCI